MSIHCPHCKRTIEGAEYIYPSSVEAVRRVLLHASSNDTRGISILALARTYAAVIRKDHGRSISTLSAKRAVERLAKDKFLVRTEPGRYRASAKATRFARDL